MIRRSLRIGIRLGLLTGIVFALFKLVQSRRVRPALPEADGWAPLPDGPPGSAQPGLVQPAMPEHPIGRRDRAPESAAPVEESAAPVEEAPLDAVAAPEVEADEPLARAPQAEASPPPAAKAPTKKRAAAKKAAKKAAKTAKKTAKKAVKKAVKKSAAAKAPAAKRARKAAATGTKAVRGQTGVRWVQPVAGSCPASHPVKAKTSSGIFHLPGMAAYNRVAADRCYPDAAAAESDGLRAAKR